VSEQPTYTFLPWLRLGVANSIQQADGDSSVLLRATIPVDLTLSATALDGSSPAQQVSRAVQVYGPGDIVGIDPKAIVKVDPRDWITNFEPNYLPYVEFYDEDFPWRYTPAAAAGERLRPWIALVVLKEGEFEDVQNMQGRPLPAFKLTGGKQPQDLFPPPDQLWAWAHVHVSKQLGAAPETELDQLLRTEPDRASSRLLAPRRLEPDSSYHAFLIPSFEAGRLAGTGAPVPATTVATRSAWAGNAAEHPYYFRWHFRTGQLGDFEYLVRLLKPRPADKRVGVRDMDVLHPGSALPPIDTPPEIAGVLRLGGALRVPLGTMDPLDLAEVEKYDQWDEHPYPHPFEEAAARLIDLADDYAANAPSLANPDGDPDPIVTLPLYARWHALTDRLLHERSGAPVPNSHNWVHELNLDPRWRVPAGFGTRVVQTNQEDYMNAAWEQVGAIIEANAKIRFAQIAREAGVALFEKSLQAIDDHHVLLMTGPVHGRVVAESETVLHAVVSSQVPAAVTSTAFRSVARPRGRLMGRVGRLGPVSAAGVVAGINDGSLLPAPPKRPPAGAIRLSTIRAAVETGVPALARRLLTAAPWLVQLVLLLALLLVVLAVVLALVAPPGAVVAGVLAAGLLALWRALSRWLRRIQAGDALGGSAFRPGSVDHLPHSPGFALADPGTTTSTSSGATDSDEAVRFKHALKEANETSTLLPAPPPRLPLDVPGVAGHLRDRLHPDFAVPARLGTIIRIPQRIKDQLPERFVEAMAYPEIDVPMYQPLKDISAELFLPNINLIPPNSITLLEANQRFVESYMVGLNHEMGRELLWREYPTDQRGSYFRQFWDVRAFYPGSPPPPDIREKLRDIPPLHHWPHASNLGDHNQREADSARAPLVLVIRGELLKRYPTAVIYAQKAEWGKNAHGQPDATEERTLLMPTAAEEADPPTSKIRTPLFEARVDPDIAFIGFDLIATEARGGTDVSQDAGWFFVIKERPGEARFGLDEPLDGPMPRVINWNDLAWSHVGTAAGSPVKLDQTVPLTTYVASIDQEDKPDPDDAQAQWSPGTDAGQLAYILYQVPVLVAVHASRML
jgi:hypothetical protein